MSHLIEVTGRIEGEPVEFASKMHLYVRTREDFDRLMGRLNNVLAEEFERMYPHAPIIRTSTPFLAAHP